jgi:hypothetical protein
MVLNGELISVRLVDGISMLRDVRVISPEVALRTAEMWEAAEHSASRAILRSPLRLSESSSGTTQLSA